MPQVKERPTEKQYMDEINRLRSQLSWSEQLNATNTRTAESNAETIKKNYDNYKNQIYELHEKVIRYRDRLIEVEARLIVMMEREDGRHG